MIVALVVVVSCVVVAVGGWGLAASLGAFRGFGGPSPAGMSGHLRGAAADYEGTWPVRQLQRLSAPVLMAVAVAATLWLLAWAVVLVVGLHVLDA